MKRIKDSILIGNVCDDIYCKQHYITGEYEHPWYACTMMSEDYIKFIKEFNEIDFSKYRILPYNKLRIFNYKHIYSWDGHNRMLGIDIKKTVGIEYNNGVQILYPHYYLKDFQINYSKRLYRFNNINKDDIIFTIRVYSDYTDEIINEFYNLNVNKIIIFPTNHNLKDKYKDNDNTKIFITDTWHYDFVNFIKEYDK